MSTYSKVVLSGSTDGRFISVAATAIGSGTTIHTAQASATTPDLVTLFGTNSGTAPLVLTLGWGSTAAPDLIVQTLNPNTGLTLLVADLPLRNSLIVKAACPTASTIFIAGYVNRIT